MIVRYTVNRQVEAVNFYCSF